MNFAKFLRTPFIEHLQKTASELLGLLGKQKKQNNSGQRQPREVFYKKKCS